MRIRYAFEEITAGCIVPGYYHSVKPGPDHMTLGLCGRYCWNLTLTNACYQNSSCTDNREATLESTSILMKDAAEAGSCPMAAYGAGMIIGRS